MQARGTHGAAREPELIESRAQQRAPHYRRLFDRRLRWLVRAQGSALSIVLADRGQALRQLLAAQIVACARIQLTAFSLAADIYIYIYIYMLHVYIYIEREREREREKEREREREKERVCVCV